VELIDEVRYAGEPGEYETALTTFGAVEVEDDCVRIIGEKAKLKVCFDPDVVTARVALHEDVDLASGPVHVRRAVFALKAPAVEAVVRLRIAPD